ncbi:MAG: DUF1573 domain-containing protein [Magnetococcales bacterium]|uniref:DUF1573 domain-containing protein n=1 Tax=Candidatus Magnetobacterium casense TaxID=1455061 RepID=A0ABS6RTU5_9BACT|nr:DUF1573 domain-containing protein [Nitrospirota bacterium]MBV6340047.1 DUF1573 domain-containing protein [Candidatus Magnetobacterium casensis]
MGPGESGFITVTYNADDPLGKVNRGAEVWTNDPDKAMTTLFLQGEIVATTDKGK